jgi:hypothetical protein
MRALVATLILLALGTTDAWATPVHLQCEVSGAAGAMTLRLSFDDVTGSGTIRWSAGSAIPGTNGRPGSTNSMTHRRVTEATYTGEFEGRMRVSVDRLTGSVRFETGGLTSTGSCRRIEGVF